MPVIEGVIDWFDKLRYRAGQAKTRWTRCRRVGHGRAVRADSRWRHFYACPSCGKFLEWIRCDGDEGRCGEVATGRFELSHGLFRSVTYLCAGHAEDERNVFVSAVRRAP